MNQSNTLHHSVLWTFEKKKKTRRKKGVKRCSNFQTEQENEMFLDSSLSARLQADRQGPSDFHYRGTLQVGLKLT